MRIAAVLAGLVLPLLAGASAAQQYQPPRHTESPPLYGQLPDAELLRIANAGLTVERNRGAAEILAEHRKLGQALGQLQPQRKGVVDAYVVAVGLDSDPVFGREAREAARVLARRYDAAGRSVTLAGTDGSGPSPLPMGSPEAVAAALARVAELMDKREDVLVLYTTSHGAKWGIVYSDGDQGFGAISPYRLYRMLDELGIANRLILLSACHAGVFVPVLASPTTVVASAASAENTSFGCAAENDWTFFGDALVNHALRKPQPFAAAWKEADGTIGGWERDGRLTPSQPQIAIGRQTGWLAALEKRMPKAASAPVGKPATLALETVRR